ncbi:MAG TPA: 1,4-dihydroxy-2-naphthoate polyprenyltransferase [Candidatus Nanopelagicaceae bacterium]
MNKWIAGARPRTLPAAIAPVFVGTALIRRDHHSINYLNALLALAVSLLLQVAVNFSNDYSDGIRGTDSNRVGPTRLVASGLAEARAVKRAAIICFALASVLGIILAARSSWWLIFAGALSILAAWTYTGGSKPYGYLGYGEISVFLFFGLVATVGSYFVQAHRITGQAILVSLPVGALSCAILAVNNLRDLPKDSLVGKRTLAVRLGDKRARQMFIGLLILAHLAALIAAFITPRTLITLAFLPVTLRIAKRVIAGAKGADLIPVLGQVGKLQLLLSTTLAIALLV